MVTFEEFEKDVASDVLDLLKSSVRMVDGFKLNRNQHIDLQINLVRNFTSSKLRKTLFMAFVLPLFVLLFTIYPLFTRRQQEDKSHLYYTCLKPLSLHFDWENPLYSFVLNEISLEDRISRYWEKYWNALSNSVDGYLLLERTNWSH